jgi:HEAT repeat protein
MDVYAKKLPSAARALPISILLIFAPHVVSAQSLPQRIAQVRDGTVRMTFASDPGVCGDGDTMIGKRSLSGRVYPNGGGESSFLMIRDHDGSVTTFNSDGGDWQPRCVFGPVRVALVFRGGRLSSARTYVGGQWRAPTGATTDLGRVVPREAATYLINLAASANAEEPGKDLLAAAVFADSAPVTPELHKLAQDRTRDEELREAAVFWLSQTGEEAAVDALADILRNGSPEDLREKAIFGLSQHPSARAGQMVRDAAASATYSDDLREKAIFWVGQRKDGASVAFLRSLYARLTSEDLKDKVIFSISQQRNEESRAWLLTIARNAREDIEMRRKAIFWAGQTGVALAELVRLYDNVGEEDLREHLIFVLSQRHEAAALDKLMDIAKRDPQREMRKKAMFWIGQSHDPRAAKFIRDVINS